MPFSCIFGIIDTKSARYKLQKYARIYSQRLGFFLAMALFELKLSVKTLQ